MTPKHPVSRLQAMRQRREQIEKELAGPLIEERDRAVRWAQDAQARSREDEERRRAAERLFATEIGKHASNEMQHFIAKEIGQHAMQAAVATVNQTIENGDYVVRIRVPELNIERRFSRYSIDCARPSSRGVTVRADDMVVRSVNIDTEGLRKRKQLEGQAK